jgi:hypothetical protein
VEKKRNYCQIPNCTKYYKHGTSTAHMKKHLKINHQIQETDEVKTLNDGSDQQWKTLNYLLTMFVVTSGIKIILFFLSI